MEVRGSYIYKGFDGKEYKVDFVANENGFQPVVSARWYFPQDALVKIWTRAIRNVMPPPRLPLVLYYTRDELVKKLKYIFFI